jgi:tRNA-specific 2-thiouridylase
VMAERFDLPNRNKPDSVDICFVPDRDYARVVKERRPDAFVEGDVLDGDGVTIGKHQGIAKYTVGQRRGLGIAAGKPIYVTQLNVENNTVTMGPDEDLLQSALIAERANFLFDPPTGPFRAEVKIRYLHKAAPATVEVFPCESESPSRVRVVFDEPQRAITPGQAVVFYDGDVVLGGAWIERADTVAGSSDELKSEILQ